MLRSNPMTSRAGTFWIEIQTSSNSPNANFEVKSLGDVTYEFDLVPTDTRGGYVGGIPGALTVTIWDKMSNTGSAYDALENEIGNYSLLDFTSVPVADASMYLLRAGESNAANAYAFPFSLRFGDVSLDERSHDTTLKFAPRRPVQTVGEWELQYGTAGFPEQLPIEFTRGNLTFLTFNSYAVGDVIENVVRGLNPNGTTIFETSKLLSFDPPLNVNVYAFPTLNIAYEQINLTPRYIVPAFYVGSGAINNDVWVVGNRNVMYDKVASFAGMDGSIFGSAFNYNFYMSRLTNTYNVEITNAEIEKLGFQSTPRDINTVTVAFTNSNLIEQWASISNFNAANVVPSNLFGMPNTTRIYSAWQGQSDDLSIGIKGFQPQMQIAFVSENIIPFEADATDQFDPSVELLWANPLADSAFRSYAAPLGISLTNTAGYRIEVDILGADKVFPHEVIKFDNTVPLRYQGKHFRPTSLAYDLVGDKVRVTAYQIDTFDPNPDPNIYVNFCETEVVSLYTWEGVEQSNRCETNMANTYTWEGVEQSNRCEDGSNMALVGIGDANTWPTSTFNASETTNFNVV